MKKLAEAIQDMRPSQTIQAHIPYGRGEVLLVVEDDLGVLEILKTVVVAK